MSLLDRLFNPKKYEDDQNRRKLADQQIRQQVQNARYGVLRDKNVGTAFLANQQKSTKGNTQLLNDSLAQGQQMRALQQQSLRNNLNPRVASAQIKNIPLQSNVQLNTAKNTAAYNPTQINRVGGTVINNPFTTGMARSTAGQAESLGGLYDLLTPGKGNSRFTQASRRAGERSDVVQKQNRQNALLYKGAQFGTDMAAFALPGAATSKVGAAVTTKAVKAPVIGKGFQAIGKAANNGNKIASATRYMGNPTSLINIGANTLQNSGYRSARGQDVSAGTVGIDTSLSVLPQAALGLAGAGVRNLAQKVPTTKPAIRQAISDADKQLIEYANRLRQYGSEAKTVAERSRIGQELARVNKAIAESNRKNGQGGFVRNPLYKDPQAPQVGRTVEKYPGLVDEIMNAPDANRAMALAKQRGVDIQFSDSTLQTMKKDKGVLTDIINSSKTKAEYRKEYINNNKSQFETVEEIGGGNGDIQNPYFMNYGNYGDKTGRQITVEFPKNKDGGVIRILNAEDGELQAIPYDVAVKMYGTTDQKILANKVVNGKQSTTPVAQVGKTATATKPKTTTKTLMQPDESAALTKTGVQGVVPPTKPPVAETPPQLTAGKQKKTRFADKTVPKSEFVSDEIKGTIKSPEYSVQTERQGYTSAVRRLKEQGDDVFEQKVFENLDKKNGTISRQEAIDAQALAAVLDGGDENAIRKATHIYEKLSEHYTAAGQLTQAAAVIARRSPEGLRQYATKTLKKAGVTMTPVQEKELTGLIQAVRQASPEAKPKAQYKVMDFVAKNTPTSLGDKIVNTWRAGLLTAPTTTGGNLLSNTGEAVVRKAFVNPVATAADKLFSLKTGKRTMTLGKAGAGTKGAIEGTKTLPDYLKTGYDPSNNAAKYDAPSRINTGSKALDTYINGTYRLMGVADMPFSTLAEKEALSSLAKAEAINRGLKGKAKSDFVNEFMANPPETALARAQKEADYATFKNPTALGKAAAGLKKPLGAAGDFVVPFTRVPASIATRIVERTPIGTANEMVKQILTVKKGGTFDQRAMSQAIGNGAFGPAIMGIGFALAGDGKLTFGYPSDEKERKLWDSEGKQPYSIRVGDRWYSLNYLQPFGTLLAIGGQAKQAKDEGKDISQIVGQGASTAGQSIMNQSFLKGIGGALDAISDPERSTRKYVEQTTSSIVPNFVRSGARAADEVQRAPEGVVEGVKSGIPGLRGQTTTKNDMFGEPLPAKDTFANQYLNPLKPSKVRGNETVQELRRLYETDNGVMPSEANKNVFGKDKPLNGKQITDLNATTGKAIKPYYDETVKSDQYKNLTDEEKAKVLKKINDVVYGAEKIAWGVKNGVIEADGSKLTKDQIAYLQGEGFDPFSTVKPKTKVAKTSTKSSTRKTSSSKGRKARLPNYTNLSNPKRNLMVNVAPVKKATLKTAKMKKYTPKKYTVSKAKALKKA